MIEVGEMRGNLRCGSLSVTGEEGEGVGFDWLLHSLSVAGEDGEGGRFAWLVHCLFILEGVDGWVRGVRVLSLGGRLRSVEMRIN